MTPNQQTLRSAPLAARFNTAAFGVLGYELDFGELTPDERKQIKAQIEFYKAQRKTFQYGRFSRYFPKENERESWQISSEGEIIAAIYNLDYHASPARDILKIPLAEDGKRYEMKTVPSRLRIARFGSLIKHIAPVPLRSDGAIMRTVDKRFSLTDGEERYVCSGEALQSGIPLAMQYSGTGYHESLRILGDFGSTMYTVTAIDDKEERK
jgi:alpha-galactosidase